MKPETISACVFAPGLMAAPELVFWLLDLGIPRRNMLFAATNARDNAAAYNWGIARTLERRGIDLCLFADGDMRPTPHTSAVLGGRYDVTCTRYNNGSDHGDAWRADGEFHSGLWVVRMDALRKIKHPWFSWPYNADGSGHLGCLCSSFASRVRDAGLTVGHAGHAIHTPSNRPGGVFIPHSGLTTPAIGREVRHGGRGQNLHDHR